jgi:hypothetical protein
MSTRYTSNLLFHTALLASSAIDLDCMNTWAIERNPKLSPAFVGIEDYNCLFFGGDSVNRFTFDYESFAEIYAKRILSGDKPKEAFRKAFLEFYNGDFPFLIERDGRRITRKEFSLDTDTHLFHYADGDIDEKDFDFLKEWMLYGTSSDERTNLDLQKVTEEEKLFLYSPYDSKDPYTRAIEEKTLKKIETERQIAFARVISSIPNGAKLDLEEIISQIKFTMLYSKDNIKRNQAAGLPEYIRKDSIANLESLKYTLLAVQKNRKWLEDIFRN